MMVGGLHYGEISENRATCRRCFDPSRRADFIQTIEDEESFHYRGG